jgi:hypothetical protein
MICQACREQRHEDCRASAGQAHDVLTADTSAVLDQRATWCDCQHKEPRPVPPATGAPGE